MKKITLMMSLLLAMGSMTTSAQILDRSGWEITTSGECDDSGSGHANAIIDGKNETFWHSNWANKGQANSSGDDSKTLPQFFQVDLGSEQEFNKIGYMPRIGLHNGFVKEYKVFVSNTPFETVGDGKTAKSIVDALGDTQKMKGTFDFSDNQSNLKTATADEMLRGRYVLFVATVTGGDPANKFASCAEFYLSKDVDIVAKNITYHYMVNGVEYGSKTFNNIVDESQITIPTMPFLANGEKTTVSDGYNIACTVKTLPFVATSTFDANTAHWYAMTMRGNSGNFLLSAKGGEAVGTTTVDKTNHPDVLEDKYQWAFVGNLKDGYKIYSKSENKPIVLDGQLKLVDGKESTFKLYETSNNDGFGFFVTEGNCLNRYNEDKIATYGAFDDGSTFRIQEPNSYVTDYAKQFFTATPENALWGVNVNTEEYRTAYETAIAEGATSEQITALATKNKEIANATFVNPIEEGKYYRLYNVVDARKWLTVNTNNNSEMTCDANAEKAVASVVSFEKIASEPGQYRMKVEGKTIGKFVKIYDSIQLVDDDSNAKGSFTVNAVGNKFTFQDKANENRYSYLHCNGDKLVGWEASAPSKWYVVPATDVEIAMTEVNGKRYASAYLPFDVKAVNGAQAYVGELNNTKDVLDMTAVNSVPANQGFVLVGDAEKATLTIGAANALPVTNALTGSNVKVALETTTGSGESAIVTDHRADYLVFGTNAGNVGFYKPSATKNTIAANKAFIAASSLTTGAGAIALNFGGNTTGINNAVVASENAPIFDLSGRRVVKAVKGGVYIQNGKKFVK
ncbi:MAG: discoidin domain-containing protein [Prevotella sp.]|nr:discoidin domain-containing protein [Prevotella sp.]MDY5666178.1 discoidin domain-containing protein [Alloprevotella sp.]